MSTPHIRRRPSLRGDDLLLIILCTAAAPMLWWLGSTGLPAPAVVGGLQRVEQLVASICAGAGTVVALWWFIALLGTAVAAVGHRLRSVRLVRIGQALSPAFLRRVAASVLGVNLLLAPGAWAGTVEHAPVPGPREHHGLVVGQHAAAPSSTIPRPGWLPATRGETGAGSPVHRDPPSPSWRPTLPAPPVPGAARADRADSGQTRTAAVRTGDCLWDIAAEELGPHATDLEIDRRWRQWHQHNRSVIGADADVLTPGIVLQAPPMD